MAEQSMVWTALPNGMTEDATGLRVSVVLSPRLDPLGEPPELGTFAPDWTDWPATLSQATMHVHYGADTVSIPLTEFAADSRVDTTVGAADSAAWQALFKPGLFVRAGQYVDNTNLDVLSYSTTDMVKLVADLYGTLAAHADGHLPTITGLLNLPGWDTLVDSVRTLDRRFMDEHSGLRDTERQFDVYRNDGFKGFSPTERTLATAQLFHTPPSTAVQIERVRTDDDRISTVETEFKQAALPAKEDFAKRLDFHQIVGAMSSYPTVLRRLGLVIDLIVAREKLTDSGDAPLWVTVEFADDALRIPRTADAAPAVHTELSGDRFGAVADPAPAVAALRVPGGLLDIDPNRFALLEVDVDGAGLKMMNFARSVGSLAQEDRRVDPVTRQDKEIGAPALRTAGLMLVHHERSDALKDRFAAVKSANDKTQAALAGGGAPPDLWAEDVVRGFRFDIWDSTIGTWRALGRRQARYLLDGGAFTIEPAVGEEEGVARLAATTSSDPESNKDLLWLHEAVVSWTGWSLAAPMPGRAIHPDDTVGAEAQTEAELPPGLDFQSRFRVVPRSLPRLRFGRRYWIRARAVDLAGNSLQFREEDFGPEDPNTFAQPFLRYEPIAAPVVALVKRADDVTELPLEGESMNRLAIRSFNDTPPDNVVPTTQTARRFAVNQQVTGKDAEQHGVLDVGGRVDPATFDLLANQKDMDARNPAAALIEEVVPMAGPLDPTPVDHTFAVYRDGRQLTYLPDPLAKSVAVRLFGHPDVDPDTVALTIPLYPTGEWPNAQPFKVELVESAAEPLAFDSVERVLRVALAKADRAKLRLSVTLDKRVLREVLGIPRWIPGGLTDEVEELALSGQHWMMTPWTTLDLVHAVQRPLVAPAFKKLLIDRPQHATSATLRFLATCGITSTDRVDVRAEWHEPTDDPSMAVGIDLARGDTAFALKITAADEYAQRSPSAPMGGYADHAVAGKDLIDVGLEPTDFRPVTKHHEFHDTRYRRIEYWLEATSKFREYLPPALLADGGGPTEEHIKVVGPRQVTWIPSSAPPPAPKVLYVVPTFGWARSTDDTGAARSWRRGGGLRVYLDRPWNASGYGEMLAVVLAPESFTGDPATTPAANPYQRRVTQWGNDPIWSTAAIGSIAPKRSAFPLARTTPDPTGAWLPVGAPATEADQPAGPFGVASLGQANQPVDVAPHDVHYDPDRQLWYCDIEIDQGASYWPFVRLAVARYQPVSVGGVELSEVVLADFMPLSADRWVSIGAAGQTRTRSVTVSGYTYDDSSAHYEASRAPSMSLINPLDHTVETLTPAHVAETTVIEVWVERLDPALGEDFGWSRLPGASVHATSGKTVPPAPPAGAGLHHAGVVEVGPRFGKKALKALAVERVQSFVTAQDIATRNELVVQRRFDELVAEGRVDVIFNLLLLWKGDVTVPDDVGPDDRLRLVIAEFEEYLIDDNHPYDTVPTAKGRRLVFVEHVPLT